MFDAPADTWHVWIGLSVVSVVLAGVAVELPTTAPPDATSLADTVDRVAASPHSSTAEHPVTAEAVRVGPHRVALRNDGGTSHATLSYGPVVPAAPGNGPLGRVLAGVPPDDVFDSPAAFREAVAAARTETPTWRPVDDTVRVRKVTWGDQNATIVG